MSEIKRYIIENGLYETSRLLLKPLKKGKINDDKYISLSRQLFDEYEELKAQNEQDQNEIHI